MKYDKITIGEICEYTTSGGTPKSTIPEFYNPPTVPWLKTKEVNYCRIYNTETQISNEGLKRSSAKLIPVNSIIVAMYGQGDTAGRVAINKIPLSTNQACCNLVIAKEKADYEFVYYALSTLYNKLVSLKNGGAQPNLNARLVCSVEIPYPLFETQQKIAYILSAYDNLIENNQKQIKLLEEAAQRLYKEWFVDLHFPGYEDTKIVDGVPEGWINKKIFDVFTYVRGKSYTSKELSEEEGDLLVNLKNIQAWGGYKRSAEKRFVGKYNDNQLLVYGDIIMAVTDMTQERRLVGHVALVPKLQEKATYSMDIIKIIPKKGVPSFFLYSLLRFSGIAENISKHANGTNVLHLKPDCIGYLDVLVPSDKLMKLFDNISSNIYMKIEILQNKILMCQQARDRLLPKLMSGELEV